MKEKMSRAETWQEYKARMDRAVDEYKQQEVTGPKITEISDTLLGHKFKLQGNQILDMTTLLNALCENPIALEEEASIMLHVFDLGMCAEVYYPGSGHMKKKVYHLAVAENDTQVMAMYCYQCISCEQEVMVEECVSPHETCPECLDKQQEEANEELRAQHIQTTGVSND